MDIWLHIWIPNLMETNKYPALNHQSGASFIYTFQGIYSKFLFKDSSTPSIQKIMS
jgi:hypothetical protein